MKGISLPRTPVGVCYVLTLIGLILSSVGLGAALWAKSAEKPSVVVVRGNDDPRVLTPGVIPDRLARDYARDFIVTLENYVPSTLGKSLTFLESRIAPSEYHGFKKFSDSRKELVKQSKQASQLLIQDPGGGSAFRDGRKIEVVLRGLRRIYVENALLQEVRAVYRIALMPGEPTRDNPTGLVVTGFSFKLDTSEKKREKKS